MQNEVKRAVRNQAVRKQAVNGEPKKEEIMSEEAMSVSRDRSSERGAGVVEWLGISALSIGMLVVLFAAMEALGVDVVNQIRASLGL